VATFEFYLPCVSFLLALFLSFLTVVNDIVTSDEITDEAVAQMELEGPSPLLALEPSMVDIADVLANNGVVHVINEVLIPPEGEEKDFGMDKETDMKDGYHDDHSDQSNEGEDDTAKVGSSSDNSSAASLAAFSGATALLSLAALVL